MESTKRNGIGKKIVSDKWADTYAIRPTRYSESPWPVGIGSHRRVQITPEASFALKCIERWAMVAAEPDGEDSSGRAKLRRMTPQEITMHACNCAAQAYQEFETRGWMTPLPSMEELAEAIKDQEDSNG